PPPPPPPLYSCTSPRPAAPAAPAPARSASVPAPDQSSASGSPSLPPLETGSRPPQSPLPDPPPADIHTPHSEFPAAQIRALPPSAFRPSLQSFPNIRPRVSQSHWSALQCNTTPPADRWSAPSPIHMQSPAACAAQSAPPAP